MLVLGWPLSRCEGGIHWVSPLGSLIVFQPLSASLWWARQAKVSWSMLVGPPPDMVDFAEVARGIAAGKGAAAVFGVTVQSMHL